MTQTTISEDLSADAQAVWKILSDFAGLKVGGPITSFETEGDGVGMIRKIGMGGATIIERLDSLDDNAMELSYSIINDDGPLPVNDYHSTIKVTSTSAGACHVDWSGTFEPRGVPEEQAIKIINGVYKNGIAQARKATGG